MSAEAKPDDQRFWAIATCSIAALLVAQIALMCLVVSAADLDVSDLPFRAFLVTTAVAAITAFLLRGRSNATAHAVGRAAKVTTVFWIIGTLLAALMHTGVGIVW
ncbi:hypothetical protein [Nocardia huaxiensis]|uniref:hypothetical protein n=1 Tax=Nocardia huaxiensis TaxID=2755382 RepID=UPI001E3D85B8|nr:hypothetical protein [Nocardia huaxiensis]UFS99577.1 hypothetical protein LPY97_17660 [Nocardia huaxiensis]